jgi:hypothetical protein
MFAAADTGSPVRRIAERLVVSISHVSKVRFSVLGSINPPFNPRRLPSRAVRNN